VEPLPMVASSCSLDELELREQLQRYRAVGEGGELIASDRRRRVIRVAAAVPDSLVARLIEVERSCCPFFELTWDPASRCLTVAVTARDQEAALAAVGSALGVSRAASA